MTILKTPNELADLVVNALRKERLCEEVDSVTVAKSGDSWIVNGCRTGRADADYAEIMTAVLKILPDLQARYALATSCSTQSDPGTGLLPA